MSHVALTVIALATIALAMPRASAAVQPASAPAVEQSSAVAFAVAVDSGWQPHIDAAELSNQPLGSWGVVGVGQSVESPKPLVWDFEEVGNRVYVAGAFTGVQHDGIGVVHDQPYLAAFDRDSGVWLDTFRPTFDRAVYALATSPSGTLLVGGEFATANGQPRSALVELDPITGATIGSFTAGVNLVNSTETRRVRELVVDGDDLYVAGRFNRVLNGATATPTYSVARLDAATGAMDLGWIPKPSGTGVWDVAIDHVRDRVHLVGYFTSVDAQPGTAYFATVHLASGAVVGGLTPYQVNNASQTWTHSVAVHGDRIYVAGAQRILQVLDASTNALVGYNTTGLACTTFEYCAPAVTGGDYQVVEVTDDLVLAGCHCFGDVGARTEWAGRVHYSSFSGQFTAHDTAMAYRAATSVVVDLFLPALEPGHWGTWALQTDTNGCLWIGGDYTESDGGAWVGGFARFCEPVAPAEPVPDVELVGPASRYVPVPPIRLVDTRDATSVPAGKLGPGQSVLVSLAGRAQIPAGATAVALNVTATDATGPGYLSVTPAGADGRATSSLNLTTGQTVANNVIVPLGPGGAIQVTAQSGAHVVIDLAGWFTPSNGSTAGRIIPLTPRRLFDTREPASAPTGFVPAGGVITARAQSLVPADAAAVVMNVTATGAAAPGYVTVYPSGGTAPVASTLNLERAGQTVANLAIVPLGAGGDVSFLSQSGTHLVADVVGYVTGSAASLARTGLFVPVTPSRLFDTRGAAPVGAGGSITRPVAGVAAVPPTALGVVVNVTATEAGAPGFVTVWDTGAPQPLASTLNVGAAGETRPNSALVRLGDGGQMTLFTQSGAHLLADVSGYLLP